jgi:acyl-homoserine-lactone acylase
MMADSPLTSEKYPDDIFNVSWDTDNPRGLRTRQLLDADDSVTREEAIAYTMDIHDYFAKQWQSELEMAVKAAGKQNMQNAEFAAAVQAILAWDGEMTPEATATSLYKFWRLKCGEQLDLTPMVGGGHLGPDQQIRLLELLAETIQEMKSRYGRWDIAWGDIHKVGREGQYFPVGGTDFRSGNKEANFSETLFNVRSEADPQHPGHFIANNGSMAMILMFFHKDGIESLTCTPWGASGHAQSPHFMDQGEKLYSKRKMKPTWWKQQDLLQHVESKRELKISSLTGE